MLLKTQVIRLIIAIAIGLIIGLERRKAEKPVGQRTLALVALGACLAAMVAVENFKLEAARMMAGIITGIGFLGAGAIMSSGGHVKGLTTATSIWAVAIIGLVVGVGELWLALIAAALVLLMLRFNVIRGLFTGNFD